MEKLGGAFSRFSEEGVGGGVNLGKIAFDEAEVKIVLDFIINK